MRLNPYHPERFWHHLGRAYFVARRYDEAIDAFRRIAAPDHVIHAFLAASHAMKGDAAAAKQQHGEVLRQKPDFAIEPYLATLHYAKESDRDHHREALAAAGFED
jgi:adenylate cyclase